MTLPKGWELICVDELAGPTGIVSDGDWVESKDQDPNGGVRLTQLADVGVGDFRNRSARFMTPEAAKRLNCTYLAQGDVLIARMPDPIGRACVFPGLDVPAVTAVDVMIWRTDGSLARADWIVGVLNSPDLQARMAAEAGGTTRQRIAGGRIKTLMLPTPPQAEQRRIVVKLDALKNRISSIRAELERTTKLTMKLRRTTLTDAFSGALTRDVRPSGDNGHGVVQPYLDNQERGVWTNKAIPREWTWVSFDEFFEDRTDSQRKVPEKSYLKEGRFPVVDQGRKLFGGFCNDESMVQRVELPAIVFGDHTRCVKFVERQFVQGADGTKVLRAASGIDARFAYYALMTLEIPAKGYSRHMKFVRKSVWPRPSLDEQRKIIERVEAAFARADRLDTEAARVTKLLDRLEASILAKAFRGELVPQDPADEPASVLLERIRAKRTGAPAAKRRGRRRAPALP